MFEIYNFVTRCWFINNKKTFIYYYNHFLQKTSGSITLAYENYSVFIIMVAHY